MLVLKFFLPSENGVVIYGHEEMLLKSLNTL